MREGQIAGHVMSASPARPYSSGALVALFSLDPLASTCNNQFFQFQVDNLAIITEDGRALGEDVRARAIFLANFPTKNGRTTRIKKATLI